MQSNGVFLTSTHHAHCMFVETSKTPTNLVADAIIELRIIQRYVLFIEPIKGNIVALDTVESGELCLQFKIPFFFICLDDVPVLGNYISEKMAELPISLDLCSYLKPHIESSVAAEATRSGFEREFKLIFSVRTLKNELIDKQECDRIGCSFKRNDSSS